MAVFRKAVAPPAPPRPRKAPIVASAARFTFGGAQTWQGTIPAGDRRWQVTAWDQYDQNGELRYATGWKGNACAQATLYAADIDVETGKPLGPTTNKRIQEIAASVLGGPTKRAQHIRTMVLNLEVAGEVYVVVVPQPAVKGVPQPDVWMVVSGTELYQQGKTVEYTHPETGKRTELGAKDTLIRIWYPHPRLQLAADSPVRALLPTLREIQRASQNISARLDSRLASAGIMTVPTEADLVTDGDADAEETYSLTEQIQRAMQASLQDPGSAGAQVPILFEVPAEFADAFKLISLETPLSKEVVALRDNAIARFAAGMDLPREVVEGMGESNHWSAAQVSEDTYRTHLVPTLDTISDALTVAYLHPMARADRIPDVEQYALQFDGSALIGESDPVPQALDLFDRGLITGNAVLKIAGIPEDYAPTGDERLRVLAERLVTASPALFDQPVLRRLLGFEDTTQPAALPPAGTAQPAAVTASADRSVEVGLASLAVLYALERAGNRLLSTQRLKAEYAHLSRHDVHVKLRPDDRHGDLLDGAWRHLPALAARWDLDGYARMLLAAGLPHDVEVLARWMASRG
jgi:hypothetical protein